MLTATRLALLRLQHRLGHSALEVVVPAFGLYDLAAAAETLQCAAHPTPDLALGQAVLARYRRHNEDRLGALRVLVLDDDTADHGVEAGMLECRLLLALATALATASFARRRSTSASSSATFAHVRTRLRTGIAFRLPSLA